MNIFQFIAQKRSKKVVRYAILQNASKTVVADAMPAICTVNASQ